MLSTIKQSLFSFFFPPICPFCKEIKTRNNYFCFSCMQSIELSLEKNKNENSVEIFCFENTGPMESFFSSLSKELHPKKIELAVSFFLLQLHQHKIEDIEIIYSPYKRNNVYSALSKNLAKKLQIPISKSFTDCQKKNTLVLGKISLTTTVGHFYTLTFLKDEVSTLAKCDK